MGLFISSTYNKWYKNRETKLLMNGLDMSGKTTILNTLKLQKYIKYDHHLGCSIEIIKHNGFNLYCWDVGGQELRYYWRDHYYQNVHGFIFIIDCCEINRMDEACHILHRIFEREELKETILLILANKHDLEKSISIDKLENQLKMKLFQDRIFHIFKINALTGEGIYEGLDWLGEQINNKFN